MLTGRQSRGGGRLDLVKLTTPPGLGSSPLSTSLVWASLPLPKPLGDRGLACRAQKLHVHRQS